MKKFIYKISLYLVLLLFTFLILKLNVNQPKKDYLSVLVTKLKLLQSNKKEKKIILLGGSGVGMGISAEMIEKMTNIKTINLGLHGGLGLTDFQSFILKQINKDDIIIFSPEWTFYTNPKFTDPATLDHLIRYNPDYGKLLGNKWYQFESFFSKIDFKNTNQIDSNNPYRFDCMNKNGDIISQCGLPPRSFNDYTVDSVGFNINNFISSFPFIQTNITILLFPPTLSSVYEKYSSVLVSFESALRAKHFIIADSISENVYPRNYFFDAGYHINCDIRVYRTLKLFHFLKLKVLKQCNDGNICNDTFMNHLRKQ